MCTEPERRGYLIELLTPVGIVAPFIPQVAPDRH